jgi:hypothetical protein
VIWVDEKHVRFTPKKQTWALQLTMSAMGQKQTYALRQTMFALPLIATEKAGIGAMLNVMSALPPKASDY